VTKIKAAIIHCQFQSTGPGTNPLTLVIEQKGAIQVGVAFGHPGFPRRQIVRGCGCRDDCCERIKEQGNAVPPARDCFIRSAFHGFPLRRCLKSDAKPGLKGVI